MGFSLTVPGLGIAASISQTKDEQDLDTLVCRILYNENDFKALAEIKGELCLSDGSFRPMSVRLKNANPELFAQLFGKAKKEVLQEGREDEVEERRHSFRWPPDFITDLDASLDVLKNHPKFEEISAEVKKIGDKGSKFQSDQEALYLLDQKYRTILTLLGEEAKETRLVHIISAQLSVFVEEGLEAEDEGMGRKRHAAELPSAPSSDSGDVCENPTKRGRVDPVGSTMSRKADAGIPVDEIASCRTMLKSREARVSYHEPVQLPAAKSDEGERCERTFADEREREDKNDKAACEQQIRGINATWQMEDKTDKEKCEQQIRGIKETWQREDKSDKEACEQQIRGINATWQMEDKTDKAACEQQIRGINATWQMEDKSDKEKCERQIQGINATCQMEDKTDKERCERQIREISKRRLVRDKGGDDESQQIADIHSGVKERAKERKKKSEQEIANIRYYAEQRAKERKKKSEQDIANIRYYAEQRAKERKKKSEQDIANIRYYAEQRAKERKKKSEQEIANIRYYAEQRAKERKEKSKQEIANIRYYAEQRAKERKEKSRQQIRTQPF